MYCRRVERTVVVVAASAAGGGAVIIIFIIVAAALCAVVYIYSPCLGQIFSLFFFSKSNCIARWPLKNHTVKTVKILSLLYHKYNF